MHNSNKTNITKLDKEGTATTFLVKLRIQAGEYEKSCKHLVSAESECDAEKQAVLNEAHHDTLIEEGSWSYEPDGSFGYHVISVLKVEANDAKVLRMYL